MWVNEYLFDAENEAGIFRGWTSLVDGEVPTRRKTLLLLLQLDKRFGRYSSDPLEEAAKTAYRWEMERLAGFCQRVVVYHHQRFRFLDDSFSNPCGGVLLAIADAYI